MKAFQTSLKSRSRRRIRRRRRRMMMMSRRWKGRGSKVDIVEDSLVVKEGMLVKFLWVLLPPVSFTCSSSFEVIFTKKKLNNHIVQIHKDLKAWFFWAS